MAHRATELKKKQIQCWNPRQHNCSKHNCSKHKCSKHNCSKHNCSKHNCSKHNCSKHNCSKHNCSKHDCSKHDCSKMTSQKMTAKKWQSKKWIYFNTGENWIFIGFTFLITTSCIAFNGPLMTSQHWKIIARLLEILKSNPTRE